MDSWDEWKHDPGKERGSLRRAGSLTLHTCRQRGTGKPFLEALGARVGVMPFSGCHWAACEGVNTGVGVQGSQSCREKQPEGGTLPEQLRA